MGTKLLNTYAAKYSNGLDRPFQLAGAPTSGAGGSYSTRATVGSLLLDTTTGKLYACTAAAGGSVTWQLIGLQT
jgi:hypothetical protein